MDMRSGVRMRAISLSGVRDVCRTRLDWVSIRVRGASGLVASASADTEPASMLVWVTLSSTRVPSVKWPSGACDTEASSCPAWNRSEEHTSELQSLMRISYAVLCLKTKILLSNITQSLYEP